MVRNEAVLSHVAFLVPSAEKAASVFSKEGLGATEAQIWDGEGTLEIYVGDYERQSALPLLMEPVKPGAYLRAMEKRGPGLHHIALDVLNLTAFTESLVGTGWLLHPRSLRTLQDNKTVYLVRSGMPVIIEVQEREVLPSQPALVEEIHMNLSATQMEMMKSLGLTQVKQAGELALVLGNRKIYFKDMI